MPLSMIDVARSNKGVAPILYDQFREVGNVLSGLILAYEYEALETSDNTSAEIFRQEHENVRDAIEATDPSDVDSQVRLMDEWRRIVNALMAA